MNWFVRVDILLKILEIPNIVQNCAIVDMVGITRVYPVKNVKTERIAVVMIQVIRCVRIVPAVNILSDRAKNNARLVPRGLVV